MYTIANFSKQILKSEEILMYKYNIYISHWSDHMLKAIRSAEGRQAEAGKYCCRWMHRIVNTFSIFSVIWISFVMHCTSGEGRVSAWSLGRRSVLNLDSLKATSLCPALMRYPEIEWINIEGYQLWRCMGCTRDCGCSAIIQQRDSKFFWICSHIWFGSSLNNRCRLYIVHEFEVGRVYA